MLSWECCRLSQFGYLLPPFEMQHFFKWDPFLPQSPEWIPGPLYCARCRGMNACSADRVSGAAFYLAWTRTVLLFSPSQFWFLCYLFLASVFYGSAGSISSFCLWSYLTNFLCVLIEIIVFFCPRQLSEITQIKIPTRKVPLLPLCPVLKLNKKKNLAVIQMWYKYSRFHVSGRCENLTCFRFQITKKSE